MNIEQTSLARRAAVHAALGDEHRLAIVDALALSDRSPGELRELIGLPSNLLAFHLDVLEDAGVVTRTRSQGDGRRRYVSLVDHALPLAGPPHLRADSVVFVCTANSARSQLAASLWSRRTGRDARSAGTEPAPRVHPLAVAVARRHGIDLSDATPRHLDDLDVQPDLVVSVCDRARETGVAADVPTLHWSVPDPASGGQADFEHAFATLSARVDRLAAVVTPP
jgi:ArsR family transcriptional regulator, arsenate/arsenite/antimonite-responsive transcriptional repressor / arsenate reductase (thioredoxin)